MSFVWKFGLNARSGICVTTLISQREIDMV